MSRWLRILPPLAVIVVAAASFALSYVALRDVSAHVGAVPAAMAWLVPIVIDGGVIGGSAVIWAQASDGGRRRLFPFLFVGALVAVSVVVNVNHASDVPLAQAIAALPPLVLLGSLELAAAQLKRTRELAEDGATREQAAAEAAAEAAERLAAAERQAAGAAAERDALRQELDEAESTHATELAELGDQLAAEAAARAQAQAHVTELSAARKGATEVADSSRELAAVAAPAPNGSSNGNGNGSTQAARPATTPQQPAQPAADAPDSPLLADAVARVTARHDHDLAQLSTRDAATEIFQLYTELGGDPMDRTLTSDLALALDSSPGYVRNVLRDMR